MAGRYQSLYLAEAKVLIDKKQRYQQKQEKLKEIEADYERRR
jgi:hypothetical protein